MSKGQLCANAKPIAWARVELRCILGLSDACHKTSIGSDWNVMSAANEHCKWLADAPTTRTIRATI
jgi:hypothetical protein